jgi:hypothetical protein
VFEVGDNIILTSNTSFNVQSGEPKVMSHKNCIGDYIIHFVLYFIDYNSPKEYIQIKIFVLKSYSCPSLRIGYLVMFLE